MTFAPHSTRNNSPAYKAEQTAQQVRKSALVTCETKLEGRLQAGKLGDASAPYLSYIEQRALLHHYEVRKT